MKRRMFAISLAAVLLLAGCGGGYAGGAKNMAASSAPSAPSADMAENSYWDMAQYAPEAPSGAGGAEAEYQGSSVYQNPGAKLIRRAELSIQTEQFDECESALKKLVADCGGYFENASIYGGGYRDAYARRSGNYTVRVPAEKYDRFFNGAGDLGYVTSKTESSEDVGERYYDTEARLKTQRTKQERLLALLEKAETMEDIIKLESALSDVEYQIEQYSSELKRYDALIGFSTFTISLNEVSRITEEVGETSSLGARMAAGFQASCRGLGQGFQDLLIWLSYNLFLAVIIAAAAAAGAVVCRRKLRKRKLDRRDDTAE